MVAVNRNGIRLCERSPAQADLIIGDNEATGADIKSI